MSAMNSINSVVESDVLVIGGGLAGCLAAIEASKALGDGGKVTIIDKGKISRSGQSAFAAGIFTVFDPREDDMDVWLKELIVWGEYLNDQPWCKQMLEQTLPIVQDIEKWGSNYRKHVFEKDSKGNFVRRRSRGHLNTKHNVVNSLPMMETLRRKMVTDKINIVERTMVTDLVDIDGVPVAAIGFNYWNNDVCLFPAKVIVNAASGSGFRSVFIGHRNLTGDLQAACFEIGAALRNMEQYSSNTGHQDFDIHGMNLYVGVGGKFVNNQNEEFMWKYCRDGAAGLDKLGNRAGLQDLTLAFCQEVAAGRGPVRLDMTAASQSDRELCRKILPESFKLWDRAGIDPFTTPQPWIPNFYGSIISGGGIAIDIGCRTSVPRLYAAGDTCCMPPHGTYSFGGINLAFTAVSGRIAGHNAGEEAKSLAAPNPEAAGKRAYDLIRQTFAPIQKGGPLSSDEAATAIQQAIIPSDYGYLKSAKCIAESLEMIEKVKQEMLPQIGANSAHELVKAIEARSMTTVAKTMATAAQVREESRGWHFRKDFPRTDNKNWLKWIDLTKDRDRIKIAFKKVDTPFVAPVHDYTTPPGVRKDSPTDGFPAGERYQAVAAK
jgi:succinate dehydrogenase/fumarate reductase flavoprotein subunit